MLNGLASVLFGGTASKLAIGSPKKVRAPHYYVTFFLRGGFDSIWTTAAKRAHEVESWVDMPYKPSALLSEGNHLYGPHMLPLKGNLKNISILNLSLIHI